MLLWELGSCLIMVRILFPSPGRHFYCAVEFILDETKKERDILSKYPLNEEEVTFNAVMNFCHNNGNVVGGTGQNCLCVLNLLDKVRFARRPVQIHLESRAEAQQNFCQCVNVVNFSYAEVPGQTGRETDTLAFDPKFYF
jgi:hypothetical protein